MYEVRKVGLGGGGGGINRNSEEAIKGWERTKHDSDHKVIKAQLKASWPILHVLYPSILASCRLQSFCMARNLDGISEYQNIRICFSKNYLEMIKFHNVNANSMVDFMAPSEEGHDAVPSMPLHQIGTLIFF